MISRCNRSQRVESSGVSKDFRASEEASGQRRKRRYPTGRLRLGEVKTEEQDPFVCDRAGATRRLNRETRCRSRRTVRTEIGGLYFPSLASLALLLLRRPTPFGFHHRSATTHRNDRIINFGKGPGHRVDIPWPLLPSRRSPMSLLISFV